MHASNRTTVLVTGAGGFIGRPVVEGLLERGWRVKAMTRGGASFAPRPELEVVRADMRHAGSLAAALRGVGAVVHLAAAKSDEPDSCDVNVGGARRLVQACLDAGCRRVVNVSTQSVKIARKGAYAATKWEADRVFEASGLDVTTLFPSVVYGEEHAGVFGVIVKFVRRLPIVPVLGDGRWVSAPVHVHDVRDAILACLERDGTAGKAYDLGGPDLVSFDDLIDGIAEALGVRRPKLHVPLPVAHAAARVASALLSRPPITVSNVLGSNQDTDIDIEPARRDLGFDPIGLGEGIERALASKSAAEVLRSPLEDRAFALEASVFGRYLLSVEPSDELASRYAAANRTLLAAERSCPEAELAVRHPRLLPFLDAACALLNPESLLRKKLLVMSAVLEASPRHAEFFLRPAPGSAVLALELGWAGARAAVEAALGVPLYLAARRWGA